MFIKPGRITYKVDRLYIDDINTYIDSDSSNNLTLTDAVTGTKTLATLSASGTDEKVGIDSGATAGYLGAAYNDGVLRVDLNELTYTDGGNYITLGLADNDTARTALGLAIGTDVLAQQTIGIADNNLVEIDDAGAADDEYCRFTANGIEGRTTANVLSDIGAAASSHAMSTHSDETTYSISTSGTLGAGNATLGTIGCGTITSTGNLIIADAGNIGSASDTDAIQIEADGDIVISQDLAITGTLGITGTVTIPTALTGVIRADSGVLSVDTDVTDIVSAASTTAQGKIEIATGAETNTGTDATRAVSPDGLDDWTGSAQIATVGTLSAGDVTAQVSAASTTAAGKAELAIASEVNTGTSTALAICPDGLAGSVFGTKTVVLKVMANDTATATGDGKMYFTVPVELNGMDLISVGAHVYTVSSSGLPTVMIHNLTDTADMLSTVITIDENEKDSSTAATPAVINGATDDVVTGDELRVDVDVAGTGAKGLEVRLGFRIP